MNTVDLIKEIAENSGKSVDDVRFAIEQLKAANRSIKARAEALTPKEFIERLGYEVPKVKFTDRFNRKIVKQNIIL